MTSELLGVGSYMQDTGLSFGTIIPVVGTILISLSIIGFIYWKKGKTLYLYIMASILGFQAFIVTFNLVFTRFGLTGSNSGLAAISGILIIFIVAGIGHIIATRPVKVIEEMNEFLDQVSQGDLSIRNNKSYNLFNEFKILWILVNPYLKK